MESTGKQEFTFSWSIENFSYFTQKSGWVDSPRFVIDFFEKSTWFVRLFPKDEYWISLSLFRCMTGTSSLEPIDIVCKHSFLPPSFNSFKETECSLEPDSSYVLDQLLRDEVVIEKRPIYLPRDVFTITCILCRESEDIQNAMDSFTCRSVIEIERFEFLKVFPNFQFARTETAITPLGSAVNCLSKMSLLLKYGTCIESKLSIRIEKILLKYWEVIACTVFIIDSLGREVECGQGEVHSYKFLMSTEWIVPLTISRDKIVSSNDLYLPSGNLTMKFKFLVSHGVVFQGVCEKLPEPCIDPTLIPSKLGDAFKSMFKEGVLCDAQLKTTTKTFPVHSLVLGAKSEVFQAMFTTDMMEKNSLIVDIPDMEADTLENMLLFMYDDPLAKLDWNAAYKLYFAADKYKILPLKNICFEFLKENVCPSNVCECLMLADLYNDQWLKAAAKDVFHSHIAEILLSDDWKILEEKRSQLAIEILKDACLRLK